MGLFVGYGAGIGIAGTCLGVVLGVWATRNINFLEGWLSRLLGFKIWKSGVYMFSEIPDRVDWSALIWIVGVGLVTAIVGSLLPAGRAARMEPARALQYE